MEMEGRTITTLKHRIRELYLMFQKDKYCVPYTRTHVFDRPLLILQQLLRENMQCWIRSVKQAISTQQNREALHGELAAVTRKIPPISNWRLKPANPNQPAPIWSPGTGHDPNPTVGPLKPYKFPLGVHRRQPLRHSFAIRALQLTKVTTIPPHPYCIPYGSPRLPQEKKQPYDDDSRSRPPPSLPKGKIVPRHLHNTNVDTQNNLWNRSIVGLPL